jgi:antitoxin VapB
MAFSIKNPRTDELARELAEETGESLTEAVTRAIEERLARVKCRPRKQGKSLSKQLQPLIDHMASLAIVDNRTPDEIIGYNEFGVPE